MSFSARPSCKSDLTRSLGRLLNRNPGLTLSLECEIDGWACKMLLWCVDPHSVSGVDNDLLHVQPDFMRVQGRVPVGQLVISKPEHDVLRAPPVSQYKAQVRINVMRAHPWTQCAAVMTTRGSHESRMAPQPRNPPPVLFFIMDTCILKYYHHLSFVAFWVWRFPAMVSRFHGPQPHPRSLWCSCCFRPTHRSCLHLSGCCWNKYIRFLYL